MSFSPDLISYMYKEWCIGHDLLEEGETLEDVPIVIWNHYNDPNCLKPIIVEYCKVHHSDDSHSQWWTEEYKVENTNLQSSNMFGILHRYVEGLEGKYEES